MSRMCQVFACLAAAAAIAACSGDGGKSAEPSSKPAPDAKKVGARTGAPITRKVRFEGTAPANPVIKMSSDSACGAAETTGESYVLDGTGLKNVFVYVK